MKKAAVYVRVSTEKQTAANQLAETEALARARGLEPVVYGETASAAAKSRPEFDRMMRDAKAGKVSAVVVWALDRLHRSMTGTVRDVTELHRIGVRVLSVREPWLDTESPTTPLLLAIFGWVAEQERTRLRERTKAGIERARAAGKTLGRPRVSPALLALGVERVKQGAQVTETANALGISPRSLGRAVKATA